MAVNLRLRVLRIRGMPTPSEPAPELTLSMLERREPMRPRIRARGVSLPVDSSGGSNPREDAAADAWIHEGARASGGAMCGCGVATTSRCPLTGAIPNPRVLWRTLLRPLSASDFSACPSQFSTSRIDVHLSPLVSGASTPGLRDGGFPRALVTPPVASPSPSIGTDASAAAETLRG